MLTHTHTHTLVHTNFRSPSSLFYLCHTYRHILYSGSHVLVMFCQHLGNVSLCRGHAVISHYTDHPVIILFTHCWREGEQWGGGAAAQSNTSCSYSMSFSSVFVSVSVSSSESLLYFLIFLILKSFIYLSHPLVISLPMVITLPPYICCPWNFCLCGVFFEGVKKEEEMVWA